MSANPVQHQCPKYIEIDIHFVRDKVAVGHVRVLHVPSRSQQALRNLDSLYLFSNIEVHPLPDETQEGGIVVEIKLKEDTIQSRRFCKVLDSILPVGNVLFVYRNIEGLNRSIIDSIVTISMLNPQEITLWYFHFVRKPWTNGSLESLKPLQCSSSVLKNWKYLPLQCMQCTKVKKDTFVGAFRIRLVDNFQAETLSISLQKLKRVVFTSRRFTRQEKDCFMSKGIKQSSWEILLLKLLNAAPILEVENFTNWKKKFVCHIIGIEPLFENIISNGTFIPMAAGQRKPEGQWTIDERKAAYLDQRLKGLIMSILLDDQMNPVINCLTAKFTWDDLILYHEGPFDVKESRVMDLNLCYNTFKFKEDSPDDEENTRSSHEYLNDLEEEYQARALLAKSKSFFKKGTQKFSSAKATDQTECHKCGKKGHFARDCWSKTSVPSYQSPFQPNLLHSSEHKLEPRRTKDFKAKYNKVKAKLALFSSSTSAPSLSPDKNKGLIAETYDWDEEEVSSDDNEVTEVKALMARTNEERVSIGKESTNNGEWVKISIKKHVNTEILKENQNLRLELKELTSITETWLNSSNKVNQCINEQIPTQKKKILGINQLTEDTSSFGSKDPVFVKSSADNSDMSITSSNIPKSSETEDSTLPNQDTDEVPSNESQRNTTDPLVVVSDSSATDYDSADESSVCSTPLLSLKKLDGAEPVSGPKTIKSILKSKSTFKVETLKGITINEPSSAPARGKSSSASKTNSAPAGKLKNVKMEDDPPLAIVMKELNELKLQISKKKSSYSRNKNAQHVPPNHFKTYTNSIQNEL
ncbi:retrovirus-related pol polyprotein from transposon TNT 1-94 [Tanacetum coccineum]